MIPKIQIMDTIQQKKLTDITAVAAQNIIFPFIKGEPGKGKIKDFLKIHNIDYVYDYAELGYYCDNTKLDILKKFCEIKQMTYMEIPSDCKNFSEFKAENTKANLAYVLGEIAIHAEEMGMLYKDPADLLNQDCLKEPIKDEKCKKLAFLVKAHTNLLNAQVRFENSQLMDIPELDSGINTEPTLSNIEPLHVTLKNITAKVCERFKNYRETGKVVISGLETGYSRLDDLLDGLQPKRLISLAARTGMGKTWVALNLLNQIAIEKNSPVIYVSLEMDKEQLIYRLLTLRTSINAKRIRRGQLDEHELQEILMASAKIESSPIDIVDDSCNNDLETLINFLKSFQATKKSCVIIIDHIGLMHSTKNNSNRTIEVGEITSRLKSLTHELNIPIIQLVQLNREADKATRPSLMHLRESGSIEQDSDIVIFIYRVGYYNAEKEDNILELIVDKNRDGERGIIKFDMTSWLLKEIQKLEQANQPKQADKQKSVVGEEEVMMTAQQVLNNPNPRKR